MRAAGGDTLQPRSDPGAGGRGVRGHLWGALQQGEHLQDAGLSSRRCVAMAVAVAGGILSGRVHRLRAYQGPPQAQR